MPITIIKDPKIADVLNIYFDAKGENGAPNFNDVFENGGELRIGPNAQINEQTADGWLQRKLTNLGVFHQKFDLETSYINPTALKKPTFKSNTLDGIAPAADAYVEGKHTRVKESIIDYFIEPDFLKALSDEGNEITNVTIRYHQEMVILCIRAELHRISDLEEEENNEGLLEAEKRLQVFVENILIAPGLTDTNSDDTAFQSLISTLHGIDDILSEDIKNTNNKIREASFPNVFNQLKIKDIKELIHITDTLTLKLFIDSELPRDFMLVAEKIIKQFDKKTQDKGIENHFKNFKYYLQHLKKKGKAIPPKYRDILKKEAYYNLIRQHVTLAESCKSYLNETDSHKQGIILEDIQSTLDQIAPVLTSRFNWFFKNQTLELPDGLVEQVYKLLELRHTLTKFQYVFELMGDITQRAGSFTPLIASRSFEITLMHFKQSLSNLKTLFSEIKQSVKHFRSENTELNGSQWLKNAHYVFGLERNPLFEKLRLAALAIETQMSPDQTQKEMNELLNMVGLLENYVSANFYPVSEESEENTPDPDSDFTLNTRDLNRKKPNAQLPSTPESPYSAPRRPSSKNRAEIPPSPYNGPNNSSSLPTESMRQEEYNNPLLTESIQLGDSWVNITYDPNDYPKADQPISNKEDPVGFWERIWSTNQDKEEEIKQLTHKKAKLKKRIKKLQNAYDDLRKINSENVTEIDRLGNELHEIKTERDAAIKNQKKIEAQALLEKFNEIRTRDLDFYLQKIEAVYNGYVEYKTNRSFSSAQDLEHAEAAYNAITSSLMKSYYRRSNNNRLSILQGMNPDDNKRNTYEAGLLGEYNYELSTLSEKNIKNAIDEGIIYLEQHHSRCNFLTGSEKYGLTGLYQLKDQISELNIESITLRDVFSEDEILCIEHMQEETSSFSEEEILKEPTARFF